MLRIRDVVRSLYWADASTVRASVDKANSETAVVGRPVPTSAFGVSVLLVPMLVFLLFVAPYYASLETFALPRYIVSVVPCMFFGFVFWLSQRVSVLQASIALVVIVLLFAANKNGTFYGAQPGNNIAEHERSEEYLQIVAVQREAMKLVSQLSDDAVIYYGMPEHYFMNHPWMGYAVRRHPGGRCVSIRNESPGSLESKDLPPQFFLVFDDRSFWGGRRLHKIVDNVLADPARELIRYHRCQQGSFFIDIIKVSPASSHTEQ